MPNLNYMAKQGVDSKKSPWTSSELKLLRSMKNPHGIQNYLDSLTFNSGNNTKSARVSMRDGVAHCFEGAIIAASALEVLGHPPLILDLRSDENVEDDDHVLAIFKRHDHYGAIAKSNCTGLRYREPIYRTPRELAASYFEDYFSENGERSLREYSVVFDLRKVQKIDWRTSEDNIDDLTDRINSLRHFRLISEAAERCLVKVDQLSLIASALPQPSRKK